MKVLSTAVNSKNKEDLDKSEPEVKPKFIAKTIINPLTNYTTTTNGKIHVFSEGDKYEIFTVKGSHIAQLIP